MESVPSNDCSATGGLPMRLWTLLCACITSAALAVTVWADDKPDDTAAVRKAIAAQNAKYAEAVTRQDLPAFMALFTDDATVMQVGKTYKGKKEREAAAKGQLAAIKEPVLKT